MKPGSGAAALLLRIAAVALTYAIAGRLGLLLAIPPGYATAVWPPSGVALAAILLGGSRLWPGVLIGSFAVNVSTSWDGGSLAGVLRSLAIAGGIAGGAALQAVAGGWLIRRLVGFRNIFHQEIDVVRMLLLGGPVSCATNATIGVTTLWTAGLIPGPNFLFNLWTWWVGDSIGVLIFMPLICAWSLRPRQTWLRKQIILTVPLVAMFALVVLLFFFVSSREQGRLRSEFERTAQRIGAEFQGRLNNDLTILDAVDLFFESSEVVRREEFQHFVAMQLHTHPDIRALDWLQHVSQAQRPAYEAMMQAAGIPGYRIWERDAQDRHVVAPERPEYFPITYIEPAQGNASALGYDILSEPKRRLALERAVASNAAAASARVRLVQDQTGQWGLIVASPVLRQAIYADTPEHPRGSLLGVCLAVFRVLDLASDSVREAQGNGLLLHLNDVTGGTPEPLLEDGGAAPRRPEQVAMSLAIPIHIAERNWTMEFALPSDYLVAHRSWQAWGLLAVGLAITGLLGALILVLISRQTKVEELVHRQTGDLAGYARELERSNSELEQFAYVASHDLQAPLRSIVGFGQLLHKDYHGRLDADADTYIDFMVKSANQMQELIRGLLAFSRIGREPAEAEAADAEAVLAEVEARLRGVIDESGAVLSHDPLPRVACPPLELGQLLQNLLGNALKFHAPGKAPRVHVGVERDDEGWRFSVRDNGIGIEARYLDRIFQMFQRLHTADRFEGTGIGLAICRKIVERHGGRLWAESVPGEGSTFFFTFAAPPPA
jgi:signal transduction histidine kinase